MDPRAKCRRQLEKAGFAGRNLENAMDLAEQSGSPKLLTAALIAAVEKKEMTPAMAVHHLEGTLGRLREDLRRKGLLPPEENED